MCSRVGSGEEGLRMSLRAMAPLIPRGILQEADTPEIAPITSKKMSDACSRTKIINTTDGWTFANGCETGVLAYYAVGKWIEVTSVRESCFAGRHCCYVDTVAKKG